MELHCGGWLVVNNFSIFSGGRRCRLLLQNIVADPSDHEQKHEHEVRGLKASPERLWRAGRLLSTKL